MKKYKYMKIGIASPEEIITWANPFLRGRKFTFNPEKKDRVYIEDDDDIKNGFYENENADIFVKNHEYILKGEVKKSETVNYRTQKPEREGLFCEVIFGPTKDNQCGCGKLNRKGAGEHLVCPKCHVEITSSKVRRERMGYIALESPVVHTWFMKNTPSKIAVLLDKKTKDVANIVSNNAFIVTKVDEDLAEENDVLQVGRILTNNEFATFDIQYFGRFEALTGATAIKYLLKNINLKKEMDTLRLQLATPNETRKEQLLAREELIYRYYYDEYTYWENIDLFDNVGKDNIALLLDIPTRYVEALASKKAYYVASVVDGYKELTAGKVITDTEYSLIKKSCANNADLKTGLDALVYMLQNLDAAKEIENIGIEKQVPSKADKERLIKRLQIVEAFVSSDNKPEWMVLDVVPVIPPDLRPMVPLEGGVFATTDLNELYRKIIQRNSRFTKLHSYDAPQLLFCNERRLLQEAVDSLIDNSKHSPKAAKSKDRPLKSLSDNLRGKQGRFRQNLLGKRVDYSGRSVICVGPFLKMYQCGIPREMALTLFKPFIINYLRHNQEQETPVENADPNAVVQVQTPAQREKAGIRKAKEMIENGAPEAMDALEKIVIEHPVLLNRAPTLHRLSIQAFEPVLVEGKAIRLHPLATTAFNADFDGDQMPVHVPLSIEAQAEARMLMLASKNILAPKDGKPVVTPSQDMIIGNYYLTIEKPQGDLVYNTFEELYAGYVNRDFEFDNEIIVNEDDFDLYHDIETLAADVKNSKIPSVGKFRVVGREGKAFLDVAEVEHAYEEHQIDFHSRFVLPGKAIDKPFVFFNESDPDYEEKKALNDQLKNMYIVTTYGRIIFNQIFPENFVFVADCDPNKGLLDNLRKGTPQSFFLPKGLNYKEEIAKRPLNQPSKKGTLSMIIAEVFRQCKLAETSLTLDKMKDLGFYYSTMAGVTISAYDVVVLDKKNEIISAADDKVLAYKRGYRRGLMTEEERKANVIKVWETAKEDIEKEIKKVMKQQATVNDIFLMADSGARGSSSNFTQLAGMRGLMAKPSGEPMEIPVKACFSEGMSMSDFFNSTHGARKGSTDTALKTADSGYLTRRLVDVSQDVTITQFDCGTDKGMVVETILKDPTKGDYNKENILVSLKERILGRFTSKPVYAKVDNGKSTKLICGKNEFIDIDLADKIVKAGVTEVEIRTCLTCNCQVGVCVKCYGSDLSTNGIVEKGEVVGIVAAQSIGEPGTQLTMRTFHSGGVASGGDDITQGLPRVQELFEARRPKAQAIISPIVGRVSNIETIGNRFQITVESDIPDNNKTVLTDAGKKPAVRVGDIVRPGDVLCDGLLDVKELLKYSTVEAVEKYILKEIHKVYRIAASVAISDKHVEIIIKQMLQKVIVIDAGDTNLLPGDRISKSELYTIIEDCCKRGVRIPAVKPELLGITRASLRSDSFLAAASFQETTRVLTEAAIRSKVDCLTGLKENIIIGGLIPAGTGLVEENVQINPVEGAETYEVNKL